MSDHRRGAQPCWEMLDCPKYVREKCPAFQQREKPCWEHEYTQSDRILGIKRDCKYCRVFRSSAICPAKRMAEGFTCKP
jgi:hypothetical protein